MAPPTTAARTRTTPMTMIALELEAKSTGGSKSSKAFCEATTLVSAACFLVSSPSSYQSL